MNSDYSPIIPYNLKDFIIFSSVFEVFSIQNFLRSDLKISIPSVKLFSSDLECLALKMCNPVYSCRENYDMSKESGKQLVEFEGKPNSHQPKS